MSNALASKWKTGHPNLAQGSCVALQNLQLVTVPCNNSQPSFFNYRTDTFPVTSGKSYLGYLCEARPILTISGSDLCQFPFQYQGKTFTSCSMDNNTLLNNNGAPWCATEVSWV